MGTLQYDKDNRTWVLTASPQVLLVAKRVFAKASKHEFGSLQLSDTLETVQDLDWFMSRYPLQQMSPDYFRRRMVEARIRVRAVEEVIHHQRTQPHLDDLALPLRDYQKVAAQLCLTSGRLLLADDLGTGKTGSSIGVLTGDGTTPCVVVTATHLVHQWQRELERFLPGLRSHVVKTGTPYDMTRVAEGRVRPKNPRPFPDVIILSYSKLAGWADTLGEYVKYIIFDECQELRSGKSTPTPAKYSAARYLASKAKYCMGLSATPVYGYGGEFFSVLDGIHPGSVGSYEEFQREWCSTSYGDKPKIKEPKVFGEWLYSTGMMLRRTRADVKRELPPFQSILQEVDTDSAALDSVSKNCAELAKLILGDTVLARGAAMDAAQEFSNQLRQATGIAKAPYVADFVRMVAEGGEKVVLFAWHRAVYDIYLEKLADLKPMLYTGSESVSAKEAAKKAFTDGDCQVLIVSLRSGSGLDGLQHICKTIVFGELDWSPGVMNQCEGRVYRDGQENPVVAYYLIASAGADPSIVDVLGLKKQQLVGVIDPNKDLVESLAVDEDRVRKLARDYLARKEGAAV